MNKDLYLCTTPFQIMASVLLSIERGGNGDLIVLSKFSTAETVVKKLRKEGCFSNVLYLDDSTIWASKSKSWIWQRLSTVGTYFKCKKLVKRICPDIDQYTDVFVSSRAQINRLVCMYVAEWQTDSKIHFFDDGLGSYTRGVVDIKKLDYYLRRVIVGKRAASFTYDLYLYSPQMYRYCHPESILKLYKIKSSKNAVNIIENVFYDKDISWGKDEFILFDTKYDDEYTKNGIREYQNLVEAILSRHDIIVKKHPRETNRIFKTEYINESGTPFECECWKKDFSKRVFITGFSTAVFTPKIITDQEPTVIILYRLLKKYRRHVSPYDELLINALQHSYNDDKVFVPETEEELLNVIEYLKKKDESEERS